MDSGSSRNPLASTVLRWGMVVSFALLIGGVIAMLRSGVTPQHVAFEDLRGLPAGLARLEGGALIHAGILVLLATPVARVVALMLDAVRRRESLFAMLSLGILLLLAASLLIGLR
ncbi:MAG: DUF1634 domain-containing protein [Thermoanaerobaculia bacterium]